MITRGWWHRLVRTRGPFSQDLRNAWTFSMKMVSYTNYAWRSGFGKLSVRIFTRCCMVSPLLNWLLLLLLLPFSFFSSTWLLTLLFSPSEEEEGEGGTNEEEGEGSTSVSTGCWFDCWGITIFWMTEVDNSHTGRPIVSPGRDNVAIWGAPIFPQEVKGLGFLLLDTTSASTDLCSPYHRVYIRRSQ